MLLKFSGQKEEIGPWERGCSTKNARTNSAHVLVAG